MVMLDVALMTCTALAEGTEEDQLLAAELRRGGVSVEFRVWGGDALQARCVVLRSTWDYARRAAEFRDWVATFANLWNPGDLVLWNLHKRYLGDLHERGVRVVPTAFLPAGDEAQVSGVVKPAVGAGAIGARRVDNELVRAEQDLIVQPYLSSIERDGEVSLVFFDGRFSHAVRKCPAVGDWRVQEEHGGSIETHEATTDELALAANALRGNSHLYARVDIVRDASDAPALMELELVEPELFLPRAPHAAARFAAAIQQRLTN